MRKILVWTLLGSLAGAAAGAQQIESQRITFEPGTTTTVVTGSISGAEAATYALGGEGGQSLMVTLDASDPATFFNVYGPGDGPGDAALAVGQIVGPMMREPNRFSGVLPTSGNYTVSVFMTRSAGGPDANSDFSIEFALSGETAEIVEGDFANGLQGGPDFWQVTTSGGELNLRAKASAGAELLGRLPNGTTLRNHGCRMAEGDRWCEVSLPDESQHGWVSGAFLREGSAP